MLPTPERKNCMTMTPTKTWLANDILLKDFIFDNAIKSRFYSQCKLQVVVLRYAYRYLLYVMYTQSIEWSSFILKILRQNIPKRNANICANIMFKLSNNNNKNGLTNILCTMKNFLINKKKFAYQQSILQTWYAQCIHNTWASQFPSLSVCLVTAYTFKFYLVAVLWTVCVLRFSLSRYLWALDFWMNFCTFEFAIIATTNVQLQIIQMLFITWQNEFIMMEEYLCTLHIVLMCLFSLERWQHNSYWK